jgi:carboxyl-terminal processing protease
MNRERLAWMVSLILITLLAFQLPGSLAQRDDDYAFVRTLVDIHRRVAANYVDPIDESKLRGGAIDGMLGELDPFSVYIPPAHQEEFDRMLEGSFKGVGIQLNQLDDGRVEVVTPIDGSPAFKAGVMAGDIIEKVNGESLDGLRLPDVIKKIAGPLGSQVKLFVKHVTGDEAELTMTREEIVVPTVKGFSRNQNNSWDYYVCDDPKIAYVRITQFTPDSFDGIKNALEPLVGNMKGLILDLRFNPGGRLDQAIQILDLFVDKDKVLLSTKGRSRPEQIITASGIGELPKFPMIVLVNEHSASASEIVAGSLMDNKRALVIGTRSYGKGSVQEVIPLESNGGELKLTVAYYYLPSGRLVHRKKDATDWGVDPQIAVPMDVTAEAKLLRDRADQEMFRRPVAKVSSQPVTSPTTAPTTQPLDVQLQRAVDTMVALIVLQGNESNGQLNLNLPPSATPATTAPVVQPATLPFVPEQPDSTAPPTTGKSSDAKPVTRPVMDDTMPVPATMPASEPATVPATGP